MATAAKRLLFGGAATSVVGGWLYGSVNSGRINYGGSHRYDNTFYMGPSDSYGGAKAHFQKIKSQPNGVFPMSSVDGNFAKVGDFAYLSYTPVPGLPFDKNRVFVDHIDDEKNILTLKTADDHVFQGIARHQVYEKNGEMFYRIIGNGPDTPESLGLQILNVAFADLGWRVHIPLASTPEQIEFEKSIQSSSPYSNFS